MKSARHKSAHNARTYQLDAATLFEINVEERCFERNKVGRFCTIGLLTQAHGSAKTDSTVYQRPLPKLCDLWYSIFLGYKDIPINGNNHHQVL